MFTVQTDSQRITLCAPGRRAEIYLFGALLNRYETALPDGSFFNAICGYDSPDTARNTLADWFQSAKLSPYACRIRHGTYRFEGKEYRCSKHIIAGHAAHGLMYDADFTLLDSGTDAQSAWAKLGADYCGSDAGFPFPYRLHIRYRLDSDGLEIHTAATNLGRTDMPFADGWHPYFSLGGRVDGWTLQINSNRRLGFDADLVPDGSIIADTRFQTASSLAGIGLDNSFILTPDNGRAACTLTNKDLSLEIFPDASYPYLQVFIPPTRDRIALENLSGAPDCFNNGLGLRILRPQETAELVTRYRLGAA